MAGKEGNKNKGINRTQNKPPGNSNKKNGTGADLPKTSSTDKFH
jgi:hypothetical protein